MKLSQIKPNPDNPRVIKDATFEKLCKSITEFPKMMSLRPIVLDGENMVLGGNMRFRALQHLGYKEIPDSWVKLASDLTEEEKRRFIIADNVSGGEWDLDKLLANFDKIELEEWGLEITWKEEEKEEQPDETTQEEEAGHFQFTFSVVNKNLKTLGNKYFALFRNNEMDLEKLKEKPINATPFVFPVLQYLRKHNIKNVCYAPAGSRSTKNGFHFVTEIVTRLHELDPEIMFYELFENVDNHIKLINNGGEPLELPEDMKILWFDDIITRGRTMTKCKKLLETIVKPENISYLIIISNH